jgi:hypothetical protein
MVNGDKKLCFICGSIVGVNGTKHHLFNYYDFRDKMIETFPEKYIDKKTISKLRLKWKKIKCQIPSYIIHKNCHRDLEKRLARNRARKNKLFWKNIGLKEELKSKLQIPQKDSSLLIGLSAESQNAPKTSDKDCLVHNKRGASGKKQQRRKGE